ncbi:Translation initiation factor IF-2 [Talaromyces islandicus]|uniref:Translation initiation factor IF-2, mitochondrial n=1 Tax=Talaromyces islandicus TaxID=28573 RepID=A0A0U1LRK3_TALIS|nr:Translation initiation factor IF-2 [Talaromyces islandicus]
MMHRRALRRICRRPYIDSTYPAAVTCRSRCLRFHSASRNSQSGQAVAEAESVDTSKPSPVSSPQRWGASNSTDGTAAKPQGAPPRKPAFGAMRFGGMASAGQSTAQSSSVKKVIGLSAAERTSRNAIMSSQPRKASPLGDTSTATPISPESQKVTNQNFRAPPSLRARDWVCPDCAYPCFGKNAYCPKCRATRPGLNKAIESLRDASQNTTLPKNGQPKTSTRPDTGPQIRKLGVDAAQAWRDSNRELALRTQIVREPPNVKANEQRGNTQRAHQRAQDKRAKDATFKITYIDYGSSKEARDRESPKTTTGRHEENDFDKDTRGKRRAKPVRREQFFYEDEDFDPEEVEQRRQKRKQQKKPKVDVATPSPLYLPEFISVSNLATVLGVRYTEFISHLEEIGFEGVNHSHVLDAETAGLIAAEYNFEPIFDTGDQDLKAAAEPEDKSLLPPRPPVVTIMGHVDHGKTTLLDWLRKSAVAASEHGGITQHIGAFSVSMPSGKSITFLDTPGHAAFLDMRRRGADMTDIVVLVVAADDSVKPQTLEAINHAKQANVPIIVAINKVDKDNVNIEKVKQDLARHSVDVEDYGGDVQAIPVSGKTGQGMLELEEAIVTQSELLDHRADTEGNAEGWVVEATTRKAGRVATILVKRGTIYPGDILVAGSTWTRIKTLKNEAGITLEKATPGLPVEVDGWKEQPEAGSEVLEASSEQHAKEVVEYRMERTETKKLGQDMNAINENRRETIELRRRTGEEGEDEVETAPTGPTPVNFIVKADVFGSVEAVCGSVSGIGNNDVFAQILRSGVGQVSEFDIKHAATSNASVINFNSEVDPMISRMAEAQGVKMMNHTIIYELIDDVKAVMTDRLPPNIIHRVTGEAEISQIFDITIKGRKTMSIAGCKVRNGVISRSKKVRVMRDKEIIYDGTLSSLKNVKKDVVEMRKDSECGMGFDDWSAFEVGDHVQSYEEIHEKRTLE